MVIRITRVLLLLQLLTISLIAAALLWSARASSLMTALLSGIAIALLLRALIVCNNFYLSRRFGSKTPVTHRIKWPAALRLFATEFYASMLSSSYLLPFRTFAFCNASGSPLLPVLLVHGYFCNSGYWYRMSSILKPAGIAHRTVDLEPLTASIEEYLPTLQEAVERLCHDTDSEKIVIVGHSMGGLVARAWVQKYGTQRVARIITLGTPHAGTRSAEFGMGENCVQMHRQNDSPSLWLRNLASCETADTRALFVSIYSHHDNIIAPQTSSYLPGAKNIELHGIGHVSLGLDAKVQSLVVEEIRKASSATTTLPS